MVYNNQNFQPQQMYNGQLQNLQQLSPLNYQGINGYNYNPQNQQNTQVAQNQHQQMLNQQYQYQSPIYPMGSYQNNYNQNSQTSTQNNNNNQVWVQGEAGAKAYPVASGSTVMLMDSENNVFYIKSTDSNGVPLPLRTFDYTERVAQNVQPTANIQNINAEIKNVEIEKDYITRGEFEKRLSELINFGKEERGNVNESTVQPSKRTEHATKQSNKHNPTI